MTVDRRTFLRGLLAGASVPALAACGGSGGSSRSAPAPGTPGAPGGEPLNRSLRFLVIGDMGTGGEGQYKVSRAMERVIAERGAAFVLAVGDNLYEEGVTSVDDPGFLDKFEYPYQNLDLPFYLCLGNHDCASTFLGGGSNNLRGNHQVAYTYSGNRYSNKWQMPERYYTQSFDESAGSPFMELFVVDSNPLTSFYQDLNRDFSWERYGYPQQQWLRERVRSSQAHWKIAMTHVPYRSNGKHGNAGNLDPELRFLFTNPDADGRRYKLFLEDCFAHQADVLLTGHDHNLQWLEPAPALGPTELILSGAAGKNDPIKHPDLNPVRYQHGDEYGFVWMELTETTMTATFYVVSPKTGEYRIGHEETRAKPITAASVTAGVPAMS